MAPKNNRSAISVPKITIPSVKSWTFGEVEQIDNKRFIPISFDGNPLILKLDQVHSPFGLSDYDQGSRRSLVLQLDSDWTEPLDCLTECLIFEAVERKGQFFGGVGETGGSVGENQIKDMYKNIVRQKEKYPSSMVAKIIMNGYYKTRFWNKSKAHIEAPADFQGLNMNVLVHLKGLYITPDSWGLIANINDCQILSDIIQCPF